MSVCTSCMDQDCRNTHRNKNDGVNEKTGKNGYKYFDQDRKSRYASVSYPCSFLGLAKNEPCKLPRDPYPRIRSPSDGRTAIHPLPTSANSLHRPFATEIVGLSRFSDEMIVMQVGIS